MITYCTNIHAGETWEEIFTSLQAHVPVIKAAVSPGAPFPVGLRLSHCAAMALDRDRSARFHEWCRMHECFVPTINAFAFGTFHGRAVKQNAYLPDWRSPERAEYTERLASLLMDWLPENMTGSLSTVPVCFGKQLDQDEFGAARRNIVRVLEHLATITQQSGKKIILAFEPEPCCYLETTEEFILFLDRLQLPQELRAHFGMCFDCCHLAVQFEEPPVSLARLRSAGVSLVKVQVSSSPHLQHADRQRLEALSEPVYLHQTVIRCSDGSLARFADIPDALAQENLPEGECRIHYHLPLFHEGSDNQGTSQGFIRGLLPLLDPGLLLEIETYTWNVLPPDMRSEDIDSSIIREIKWLESEIHEANSRT